MTTAASGVSHQTLRREERLRSILWVAFLFAALKLLIQIIGNVLAQRAGYGIFRDEMYYLVCGRHPAFGYVDQPPLVALQARLSELLFGYQTMWSLRLISAVAGAAKVFLTGVLVWAIGGGRRAAALAMLAVIAGGVYLGIDSYLSMNSFDPVLWMLCVLALIRIGQSESSAEIRNWWIVLGVSAGLAFENKDSVVFFLVAMLVALLLTPQRRILANRWFAVSVLLIVVVALPNFLWQVHYHFPTLEWLQRVQATGKDVKLPPLPFLWGQINMLTPHSVLLWGTGVLWLLFTKAERNLRFLGIFYMLFLALMMALHAKDYYLAPAYPVFFAAGAVAWFRWARHIVWRNALISVYAVIVVIGLVLFFPFSVPVLPPQQWIAYAEKLHYVSHDSEVEKDKPLLPQFYADRFGWQELAEKVGRIYNALPPQERAVTGIFGQNYGEAGAIDVLGRQYGLPEAISSHQTYWMWGPRGYTGQEMIVISDASMPQMLERYASCEVADRMDNPYSMPYERRPIYLCRGRKKPYEADWKELKLYH
ncbi:glycosyltransferase family 39 protein [Alloacidobacterium dinghuense]|uniref:Glycosyltransferase family 39 protein n=1 Tax=Alloacidobacterium dinghuense TaxID=2763107 RepID=A0A7G8BNJ6_9BACT|nr:glycosyltransferase family 39 protein [Alloacidobacterium dinghuense]QNI34116.1 glycosyltransferase family 39 protein [Alloacidobacterium dinghuense]